MKMLVPINEFGLFADSSRTAKTTSQYVAKFFRKEHNHVLRDIENLDCSEEFRLSNFGQSSYINQQGKKQPCIEMSFRGFMFLTMGYRGKKASQIKENYIKRFDEMEQFIAKLTAVKDDFSILTDGIKAVYGDDAPHYIYSNEINMINRLITGKSAKDFRAEHDIPKGESIRPYLTAQQLDALDRLQKIDVGLLVSTPEYADRKALLQQYYERLQSAKEHCA